LQALSAVVRAGSIMVAAEHDPNRQSLISRQIGELEEALGVKLLARAAKPHRPTAVAERLAAAHGRLVRELGEAAAESGGGRQPVVVGAGELVIREVLVPWIRTPRRRLAMVSWVMRNLTSRRIQEELALERLDAGLASGLEWRTAARCGWAG
jgi:DNA-binding transcriptional LysR family regulator